MHTHKGLPGSTCPVAEVGAAVSHVEVDGAAVVGVRQEVLQGAG